MPDSSLPAVVAVGGDPGGAAALGPVLSLLQGEGAVRVAAYPYGLAVGLWNTQRIPVHGLPARPGMADARKILSQESAHFLVTSTSSGRSAWEKYFIAASRNLGIPSLSLLDFWSNYRVRWGDSHGRLAFLPDRIAVMDVQARDEMVAEGFPPAMLVVTGQPVFDDLPRRRREFNPLRRQAVRRGLGARPEDLLVIFASQPLSRSVTGEPGVQDPGYSELTVIPLLINALERIGREADRDILLAIRPHPREDPGTFQPSVTGKVRVDVVTGYDSRDLVMAADLVLGMTTALLVEACSLGCVVGSLQPGLRGPDVLPTNRTGCSRGVYRAEDIKPVVEQLLLDPLVRNEMQVQADSLAPVDGATRRVADLILRTLTADPQEPV